MMEIIHDIAPGASLIYHDFGGGAQNDFIYAIESLIDAGASSAIGDRLLAERVRGVVADAANAVLAEADAALGPAPLVADLAHARRVADLHLYLRQHHALRDSARIGREVVAASGA